MMLEIRVEGTEPITFTSKEWDEISFNLGETLTVSKNSGIVFLTPCNRLLYYRIFEQVIDKP